MITPTKREIEMIRHGAEILLHEYLFYCSDTSTMEARCQLTGEITDCVQLIADDDNGEFICSITVNQKDTADIINGDYK